MRSIEAHYARFNGGWGAEIQGATPIDGRRLVFLQFQAALSGDPLFILGLEIGSAIALKAMLDELIDSHVEALKGAAAEIVAPSPEKKAQQEGGCG